MATIFFFFTEMLKKRRLFVKLCKIRLYSFSPAMLPFIVIVITIIVVNILSENITHPETDSERMDSPRESQLKPLLQKWPSTESSNSLGQWHVSFVSIPFLFNISTRFPVSFFTISFLVSVSLSIPYSKVRFQETLKADCITHTPVAKTLDIIVCFFSFLNPETGRFSSTACLCRFRSKDTQFLQSQQTLYKSKVYYNVKKIQSHTHIHTHKQYMNN